MGLAACSAQRMVDAGLLRFTVRRRFFSFVRCGVLSVVLFLAGRDVEGPPNPQPRRPRDHRERAAVLLRRAVNGNLLVDFLRHFVRAHVQRVLSDTYSSNVGGDDYFPKTEFWGRAPRGVQRASLHRHCRAGRERRRRGGHLRERRRRVRPQLPS